MALMYEIGKKYRISHTDSNGFRNLYTGEIIKEDETSIKIISIKNEDIILKKENITMATPYEERNNGYKRD